MSVENIRVIKYAAKQDAELVTRVLSEGFQEFKAVYTKKAYNATVISPEEVIDRLEQGTVWIYWLNDKPVGTVSGKILQEIFYIQGMAVLPEARGQKIGFALLKTIELFAKKQGCNKLLLNTTPYLKQAIKLYERFGFEIINKPPYELFGTPLFNMMKII